jgi:prepilin-type N-terminal cleavage/methylation domain-containing protein
MREDLREKRNEAGFSMMELIVAMAILLVVMTAVFSLLRGTIQTAGTNYEVISAQQSLRNSQDYVTRDILTVGDGLFGVANIWLPTRFVTDYLTVRPAADIDPDDQGFVAVGSVISDRSVPAGTNVRNSNPATSVLPNSDRITMLAIDAEFTAIDLPVGSTDYANGRIRVPAGRLGDFTVGEIYYITNGASGVFGTVTRIDAGANQIFWEENDQYGFNRYGVYGNIATGTRRGSDPATLLRINIKHYFVDAAGKLIRRVFGVRGKGFLDSVVAEHLVALDFRYTLEPAADDAILSQPSDQILLSEATLVRLIESNIRVKTARAIDGNSGEVEATARIGVRNIQFLEAPVPRDSQGNTNLPNPQPTPQITPTPTPTPVPTPTPIPTPTPSPTPRPSPTATPPPTPVPTPRPPTPTPTPRPPTPTPTPTPPPVDG